MALISIDKFVSEGNVRSSNVPKSDENYKALKSNIKDIGLIQPITYRVNDDGDFVVVDGHQRLQIHKDLKLTEIKAYETNGEVDDLTKQLSTNMFRVPMTHLDASFAIDQMVEKGLVTTKKELMKKFGKTGPWVVTALSFCNLHPLIRNFLKDRRFDYEWNTALEIIADAPVSTQEREILERFNDIMPTQEEFDEYVLDYAYEGGDTSIEEYLHLIATCVESDKAKVKHIKEVIGVQTYREYEESNDCTPQFQSSLFGDDLDEYFCLDDDFTKEVYLSETPIGHFLMDKEIEWTHNLHTPDGANVFMFDFGNKVSTLKSKLKKSSGTNLGNVNIVAWSGSVFSPRLWYEIMETEEPESYADDFEGYDDVEEKKDPHQLKYNKFNKWAYAYLVEHIEKAVDPLKCNQFGLNETFEWLMADLQVRPSFDVGWYEEEEGEGHPLKDLINRSENHTNDDLIQKMITYWFISYYQDANFEQIDRLLEIHEAMSCRAWLGKIFMEDKEARINYLKVLSKDECVEIATEKHNVPDADYGKMKKDDLVTYMADMEYDEIPFWELVLTSNGSGANHIGAYRP